MSNLKIHLCYVASFAIIGSLAYYYFSHSGMAATAAPATAVTVSRDVAATGSYSLTSQKGYDLIQPLLQANQSAESPAFSSLKARLQNTLADDQRAGLLSSASVYLYSLADGKWMYLNPSEEYNPGSLIKVPMLMTWLRESEKDPSLMNKRITFANGTGIPVQTYNSQAIQPGRSYTVKELLHYMIAFSDNNATHLLNSNVGIPNFVRTFTDLNLAEPNVTDRNYQISAKNISEFMVVLYYSTYLSRTNSEYAMELLSQCDFKEGFLKDIPSNIRVAHKFGEWGDNRIGLHELHESGIFYLHGKPYLLTVMTKGNASPDLARVVGKISRLVYDDFAGTPAVGQAL